MALARVKMSARCVFGRGSGRYGPAPAAAGEVADLAFHHGPIGSVVLLPGRILLAGLGLLQGGFMEVDVDHPPPAGFGALRPQWAGTTQRTKAGRGGGPS